MSITAIVTAAGSGTRLGAEVPKALVAAGGESLVCRAVRVISGVVASDGTAVTQVIVTAPLAYLSEVRQMVVGAARAECSVTVVPGGATRQLSVSAALGEVNATATVVLVHDAARAFAPAEMITRVLNAVVAGHRSVIPVIPVADTLCTVDMVNGMAMAGAPVDRGGVRAVQTPQGFDRATLVAAHAAAADAAATDDAGLVAVLGIPAFLVDGDDAAAKITTAHDLAVAHALHAAESAAGSAVRPSVAAGTVGS